MSTLTELLKDFQYYDPVRGHHSGNLKQHSLWVSYYIQDAIDFPTISPLGKLWLSVIHINSKLHSRSARSVSLESIKKIITCAAILHDIGKGGDHEFKFYAKPGHEQTGYDILNNDSKYIFKNNTIFSTKKLINNLNLTKIEYDIIKILTLNHWSLGNLIIEYNYIKLLQTSSPELNATTNKIAIKFIKNLQETITDLSYINKRNALSKIVILLQFILCCADVMGAQPYCGKSTELEIFPLSKFPIFKKECFTTENISMYKKYYYSEIIKNIGDELLKILHI